MDANESFESRLYASPSMEILKDPVKGDVLGNQLGSVLVVDNDQIIREFLGDFFRDAELRVETAEDGLEALDKLETFFPDLILMDLVMPHIDGRTLCRIIRSKKRFARTPIVVISGIASEESANLAELGADICIGKSGFSDLRIMMSRILHDPGMLSDPNLKNRLLGVNDLAPRKITRELLEVNRFSAAVLNSITNGILTINTAGRILYANPAALRIFSVTMEQMLGGMLSEWFPDHFWSTGSLGCHYPGNVTVRMGDRILNTCTVAVETDAEVRVIILEDITEQEKARDALEQANRILEQHARIDFLTSTYNRRHFSELLDQEWARMRREKGVLSLLVCDVDYFKDYNDSYGHVKGDQCLQAVAGALKSVLQRPSDHIARYGGDEFVVLLPGTSFAGAVVMAEKALEKINELSIEHRASRTTDHVTMSIGVAHAVPGAGCASAEKLLSLADKALYEAKDKGRNCFVVKKTGE